MLLLVWSVTDSPAHTIDGVLSRILHTELHWLNVHERVAYIASCAHHGAQLPGAAVLGQPLTTTIAYQSPMSLLGSISGPQVDDSWFFHDTGCKRYGRRAFSVAGQSAWNSMPDNLRDPNVPRDSFRFWKHRCSLCSKATRITRIRYTIYAILIRSMALIDLHWMYTCFELLN